MRGLFAWIRRDDVDLVDEDLVDVDEDQDDVDDEHLRGYA